LHTVNYYVLELSQAPPVTKRAKGSGKGNSGKGTDDALAYVQPDLSLTKTKIRIQSCSR
jgi:hypothetical protein